MIHYYAIQVSWPSKYGAGYSYEVERFQSETWLTGKQIISSLTNKKIRDEIRDGLFFVNLKQPETNLLDKRVVCESEDHSCGLTISDHPI